MCGEKRASFVMHYGQGVFDFLVIAYVLGQ